MNYTIADLEKGYEMELDELGVRIKELGVGSVLLQLPDGLKPFGVVLCDYLSERVSPLDSLRHQTGQEDVDFRIWLGSCFGACDLPDSEADLVVQFGHSRWNDVSSRE